MANRVTKGKALVGAVAVGAGGLEIVDGATMELKGTIRNAEAHTASDTLTAAESGSMHTNEGASGTITLTLPAATAGLEFLFQVQAAQQLRLDPNGTETVSLPSTGVAGAAGKYLVADAVGESVQLACFKAGTWAVLGYTGTWTSEA